MTEKRFGYARISTPKQSLENQISLLEKSGCDEVFQDVGSGYKCPKPGFENLKNFLREGDIVVVTAIDRLGRTTLDLHKLLEEFHEKQVHLSILGYEDLDTRTPSGKLMFNCMAMLAENERMRHRERMIQALEGARKRGKYPGHPRALDKIQANRLRELYKTEGLKVMELCEMFNISKPTLYNYINKY